jgi:tetratricopeptide (TPR) repeat protein
MKVQFTYLILFAVSLCIIMMSCDSRTKRLQRAQNLYEEGVRLREMRLSEDATQCFLEALTLMDDVKTHGRASLRLTAEIKDNLGAMYNKHQMFDEALAMHREALTGFKATNDSVGMMMAWRNCGRVTKSMQLFPETKAYYDSAFQIATLINKKGMIADLNLELGRDYYMEIGDYQEAIERVHLAMQSGLKGNDLDIANMTLGILYYYIDENEVAKTYLEKALQSDRAGVRMSVYQTLYGIALNEENLSLAVDYEERFLDNMALVEQENSDDNVQRIKAEYGLKAQKNELEAKHRTKSLKLYLTIAAILVAILAILLIIKKKISDNKIKSLEKEIQMRDKIMLSNKVFVTAKSLSEHLTAETMNFSIDDSDWKDFISLTDLVYDGFSQRLLKAFPKLSKWDVCICCLTKSGFSNQVISILLDTRTDSYYKRKTRIKQQKMNLGDDQRSFEEIVKKI